MREDRDLKVNADASDRLTLGLVNGDRECQTHRELATFQLEWMCYIVFGWLECDSGDELGLPMVVAPDYFNFWSSGHTYRASVRLHILGRHDSFFQDRV